MISLLTLKYFFCDLKNFIKLKFVEGKLEIGFFCENHHIFNYLQPYILNKIKKKYTINLFRKNK